MSDRRAVTEALVAWFRRVRRDLPWRQTRDPYHIWVSEIMLQQTQVATVIPYYERFLARFPTPAALATAPTERVLKAWEGLGYYSRARNLQAGAAKVVAEHGGRVPDTWDAVRALPGVGEYTAGAILSIAYGVPVPAVDGNVLRVLSRVALIEDDITKPATKRAITAIAASLVPSDRPGDLNEALMELGATICTPTKPRCAQCPIAAHCEALAAGRQEALPVKAKKAAAKAVTLAVALLERDGRYLIVKRPDDGIWAGLWAFPTTEVPAGVEAGEALGIALLAMGLETSVGDCALTVSHTLTHRQLTMPVHRAVWRAGDVVPEAGSWVRPADFGQYALPVPMQKIARSLDPGPLFRLRSEPT
ncbi:MAG: A/G-specific adenine glycosylase [Candidatus Sericytochromatia bacterium]